MRLPPTFSFAERVSQEAGNPPRVAGVLLFCVSLFAAFLLAACASRPETGYLTPVNLGGSQSTSHEILVATTRARDSRPGTYFNGERAGALDFAQFTVDVPPQHVSGEIEWSSDAPGNPEKNFVVSDASYLDSDKEFVKKLNSQLALRPRGSRNVLLFIHGYNTMFAEGLYRLTQIVHDSQAPGVPVLFTWASRGKVGQYVYDTNSATIARDDLVHAIRLIFASDVDKVNIVAHSMGNWVTVEALRQIKISGEALPLNKIGLVVLAAPDIDIDVFKSQMRSFGKPKRPFYIVISKDDKALRVSNFIAGGQARLGAEGNVEELAALGAVVVDMTDVKANDSSHHGKFAELGELGPRLGAVLAGGISGTSEPRQTRNGGALQTIVTAPIVLVGGTVQIIRGP